MIRFLWRASRGDRLRPWCNPYILWLIETYWGLHAERITAGQFWRFLWAHRREFQRFLSWAERMAEG